jgi:hypothetical protein
VRRAGLTHVYEQQVKLQLLPSNLPYRREMRVALEAAVAFTPSRPGSAPLRYARARVFVLSDLLLVAEAPLPGERESDLFLLFPPLSGKFLKVNRLAGACARALFWWTR